MTTTPPKAIDDTTLIKPKESSSKMKSLKDRMGKAMSINTVSKPKIHPAGAELQVGPTANQVDFKNMTEDEFRKLYMLRGEVMESTNRGMSVLFAKRLSDGAKCVVKVRARDCSFSKSSHEREWRETTLAQLNMPFMETMCQLYDVISTPKNYYVVMEEVAGMDLLEQLSNDTMKPNEVREVVFQICEALKGLHKVGRIHKDIKLENVMVDMASTKEPSSPGGRMMRRNSLPANIGTRPRSPGAKGPATPRSPGVKLIDFDTVVRWEPASPKSKDVLGTDGYIAPEAYKGEYSPASDIYSAGIIMYKLLTKKYPHDKAIFDDQPGENWVGSPAMARIRARLQKESIDFTRPPLDKMPEAVSLCQKMLAFEPEDRPSAAAVLEHKWFKMDTN
jgi:serine/threonine protein kinase